MKKSNWIIVAILVVASAIFLWFYFYMRFNLVHQLDLILSIVWWILIIAICVIIHVVEERRIRAIRTSFLAKGIVYNPEVGIEKVSEDSNVVDTLEYVLKNLDFKAKKPDESFNDKRIRFDYIVHSDKFSLKRGVWTGNVVDVAHNSKLYAFSNKKELKILLGVPTE